MSLKRLKCKFRPPVQDKSSKVTDLTEATPLSSPDTSDTTSNDIYDKMQGDEGPTRGDISPSAMETVEGSGSDFTDPLLSTYTSEFESTFEGSGTSDTTDELFTTVSGATESVEGSTEDSTGESMTQETTESGGESTNLHASRAWLKA